MAISAFIVKVPSAEFIEGALRERFDATSKPAHITVLVPFMDPSTISVGVLEQAKRPLEQTAAFSFALTSVGRFPATAYLAPEPAAPFIAMTQTLAKTFPGRERSLELNLFEGPMTGSICRRNECETS
jgi:hypothetical protein